MHACASALAALLCLSSGNTDAQAGERDLFVPGGGWLEGERVTPQQQAEAQAKLDAWAAEMAEDDLAAEEHEQWQRQFTGGEADAQLIAQETAGKRDHISERIEAIEKAVSMGWPLVPGEVLDLIYALTEERDDQTIPTTPADECVLPVDVPQFVMICGAGGDWWMTELLGPEPNLDEMGDEPPGTRCAVYDLSACEATGVFEMTGELEIGAE